MSVHAERMKETVLISCRKVNFSGRTNSLRFQTPSAKGFVQMLACVLGAPSNQGMRGHWAC